MSKNIGIHGDELFDPGWYRDEDQEIMENRLKNDDSHKNMIMIEKNLRKQNIDTKMIQKRILQLDPHHQFEEFENTKSETIIEKNVKEDENISKDDINHNCGGWGGWDIIRSNVFNNNQNQNNDNVGIHGDKLVNPGWYDDEDREIMENRLKK